MRVPRKVDAQVMSPCDGCTSQRRAVVCVPVVCVAVVCVAVRVGVCVAVCVDVCVAERTPTSTSPDDHERSVQLRSSQAFKSEQGMYTANAQVTMP